jgi:hypothetical protein
MATQSSADDHSLERYRSYLRLLACLQLSAPGCSR